MNVPVSPQSYSDEEKTLAAQLVTENYDSLIRIARQRRRRAGVGDTMRTEDIVHESFRKLDGDQHFVDSEHFMHAATLAMRHIIVDYARKKLAVKRGGGQSHAETDVDELPEYSESPEELAAIGDLLERLEQENPRWMRIVDARYFAGMTEQETAALLGVSDRTVRRDWSDAREWLAERIV